MAVISDAAVCRSVNAACAPGPVLSGFCARSFKKAKEEEGGGSSLAGGLAVSVEVRVSSLTVCVCVYGGRGVSGSGGRMGADGFGDTSLDSAAAAAGKGGDGGGW